MPSIHTAQILIGRLGDQGWSGGINPSHVIWLTENGAAGLHLDRWWPPWAGDPPWLPGRAASIADWAVEAGLNPNIVEGSHPEWYWHPESPVTWIPRGPQHGLEDALLMIAIHVLRDEALLQMVRERCPALAATRADGPLPDGGFPSPGDMDEGLLVELQERCSELRWDFKLVITIFEGSMLTWQQHVLENYGMAVEVCNVSYHRKSGADGSEVWGSLAPPVPWDRPHPWD